MHILSLIRSTLSRKHWILVTGAASAEVVASCIGDRERECWRQIISTCHQSNIFPLRATSYQHDLGSGWSTQLIKLNWILSRTWRVFLELCWSVRIVIIILFTSISCQIDSYFQPWILHERTVKMIDESLRQHYRSVLIIN